MSYATDISDAKRVYYANLFHEARSKYMAKCDKIMATYFDQNKKIMFRYLIKAGDEFQLSLLKIKNKRALTS